MSLRSTAAPCDVMLLIAILPKMHVLLFYAVQLRVLNLEISHHQGQIPSRVYVLLAATNPQNNSQPIQWDYSSRYTLRSGIFCTFRRFLTYLLLMSWSLFWNETALPLFTDWATIFRALQPAFATIIMFFAPVHTAHFFHKYPPKSLL